jgi:hypothetical protein
VCVKVASLKTEVEKGSAQTVLGCGSVDPKGRVQFSIGMGSHCFLKFFWGRVQSPKGNQVKIPELELAFFS